MLARQLVDATLSSASHHKNPSKSKTSKLTSVHIIAGQEQVEINNLHDKRHHSQIASGTITNQ